MLPLEVSIDEDIRHYLNGVLRHCWIGRRGRHVSVLYRWPRRSPDLTPCKVPPLWKHIFLCLPTFHHYQQLWMNWQHSSLLPAAYSVKRVCQYRTNVVRVTYGSSIKHVSTFTLCVNFTYINISNPLNHFGTHCIFLALRWLGGVCSSRILGLKDWNRVILILHPDFPLVIPKVIDFFFNVAFSQFSLRPSWDAIWFKAKVSAAFHVPSSFFLKLKFMGQANMV